MQNDLKDKIPPFYEFFNPVLEILKNANDLIHREDLKNKAVNLIIKKFNLPKEIIEVKNFNKHHKDGYSVINNWAGWAVSYLSMCGYISNEKKRGHWEITPLGLENYPVNEKNVMKIAQSTEPKYRRKKENKTKDEYIDDMDIIKKTEEIDWKENRFGVKIEMKEVIVVNEELLDKF